MIRPALDWLASFRAAGGQVSLDLRETGAQRLWLVQPQSPPSLAVNALLAELDPEGFDTIKAAVVEDHSLATWVLPEIGPDDGDDTEGPAPSLALKPMLAILAGALLGAALPGLSRFAMWALDAIAYGGA